MNLKEFSPSKVGLFLFVIIICMMMLYSAAKYMWPSIPDDNPVEELIEGIIEKQTGVDFDFTPYSGERD